MGCSRGIHKTREIERACRENVNFMYLLEGCPAPDHNTTARFRREHLPYAVEDLLTQMVKLLVDCREISFEESAVFIDGTKIEANANRYSFVWKTAITKQQLKLGEKIASELPKLLADSGTGIVLPPQIAVQRLKKLRKQLYAAKEAHNVVLVRGKGRHKSGLLKAIETINSWLERLTRYNPDIHICGDRNSYSKTDPDATFMHMKQDHLRVNRSIQSEGFFAMIKEDMIFRRFLTRGNTNVMVGWYLVSMAYNLLKLHHKIQTGQLGKHLIVPTVAWCFQKYKQHTFLRGSPRPSAFVRCFSYF